jgi:hypothetical protein
MIEVREALALDGIVYGPADEIPLKVWLRLPQRERNTLLSLGRVELNDGQDATPGASLPPESPETPRDARGITASSCWGSVKPKHHAPFRAVRAC